MFITFEGVDKTGKSMTSNAVGLILNKLKISNIVIHESDDPIIQYIKQTSLSIKEIVKLVWKMRQEHQIILNRYSTDVIIFDRYFDSTYVYGNELMTDLTANANYDTAFFMVPRATIYLYGDPDILSKRNGTADFFSSASRETIIDRMELYKDAFNKYPLNRKLFRVDTSKKNIKQTSKLCANFIKTMVKREVK